MNQEAREPKVIEWYRHYEAWIMLALSWTALFAMGFMCAQIEIRSDYHDQLMIIQSNYEKSLSTQNALIAKLAQVNATTAGYTANAAAVAANAAGQAQQATTQAKALTTSTKKSLDKLK